MDYYDEPFLTRVAQSCPVVVVVVIVLLKFNLKILDLMSFRVIIFTKVTMARFVRFTLYALVFDDLLLYGF